MMKAIKGIFFLLVATLLSGCVKENLDDCPDPEYNLVLLFEYYDKAGKDILADRIEGIDVLIYDKNYNLYHRFAADDVIPDSDRRKYLMIEPDTYYILSWANNFTDRATRPADPESTAWSNYFIYHNLSSTSADPLHYAPDLRSLDNDTQIPGDYSLYRVIVSPTGTTYHTLSYMSAHRTVNVYLKGFDEIGPTEDNPPLLSIANLTEAYDYFLKRGEETVVYTRATVPVTIQTKDREEEEDFDFASFYVPHFDNESPVTIHIDGTRFSGESYTYSVSMDSVLKKLEMIVSDGDDAVIDVILELVEDMYVEVKLPYWLSQEVEIEFN